MRPQVAKMPAAFARHASVTYDWSGPTGRQVLVSAAMCRAAFVTYCAANTLLKAHEACRTWSCVLIVRPTVFTAPAPTTTPATTVALAAPFTSFFTTFFLCSFFSIFFSCPSILSFNSLAKSLASLRRMAASSNDFTGSSSGDAASCLSCLSCLGILSSAFMRLLRGPCIGSSRLVRASSRCSAASSGTASGETWSFASGLATAPTTASETNRNLDMIVISESGRKLRWASVARCSHFEPRRAWAKIA
mmetsp:Transcript_116908/g.162451  ORF Transcript_116908/g.162451 Transcript_116908/m.162451 type:complete len:248 (+) Transcript_116908:43-786(+)